jgi:hypothetical protein
MLFRKNLFTKYLLTASEIEIFTDNGNIERRHAAPLMNLSLPCQLLQHFHRQKPF